MEKLLQVKDIAEALGIHPATVRIMMRQGEIPCKKVGRRWYILESEFVGFMRGESAEDSD